MTPRTGRAVTLAATVVLAGATSTAPAIAADTPTPPEVTVWIPVSDTPITVTVSTGTVVPPGPRNPDQPPAPGPAPTGIEVGPPGSTAPPTAPPPSTSPASTPPPAPTTTPGSPAPTSIEVAPPPSSTTSSTPPAPSGTSTSPPPPPPQTAAPTGPTPGGPLSTPTAGPAPLTEPGTSPSSTPPPSAGGPSPTEPATPAPPVVDRPAPTDPTAAPAPPSGANRSGKPWQSGVFSHTAEYAQAWEQTTGQAADILTVFPTRGSFGSMMNAWWLETAPPGFTGTISVGVPLWPADGDLATAARGGYDAQWKDFARLVASKYPDAYIRLAWEFNIPSWDHAATPENLKDWVPAWRLAVQSMKSVAPKLKFDWNPNGGPGQTIRPATLAYPGDDVVDVVGVDAYDWDPPVTDDASWQKRLTEDGGLQGWADFARAHGKKLSFPNGASSRRTAKTPAATIPNTSRA